MRTNDEIIEQDRNGIAWAKMNLKEDVSSLLNDARADTARQIFAELDKPIQMVTDGDLEEMNEFDWKIYENREFPDLAYLADKYADVKKKYDKQ